MHVRVHRGECMRMYMSACVCTDVKKNIISSILLPPFEFIVSPRSDTTAKPVGLWRRKIYRVNTMERVKKKVSISRAGSAPWSQSTVDIPCRRGQRRMGHVGSVHRVLGSDSSRIARVNY